MFPPEIYIFVPFTLDADHKELRRREDGSTTEIICTLRPQAFELLLYLVRNRDRAVSKEELGDAIRNERAKSRDYNPNSVEQALRTVRTVLGDDGDTYITIPLTGYLRFKHPVNVPVPPSEKPLATDRTNTQTSPAVSDNAADPNPSDPPEPEREPKAPVLVDTDLQQPPPGSGANSAIVFSAESTASEQGAIRTTWSKVMPFGAILALIVVGIAWALLTFESHPAQTPSRIQVDTNTLIVRDAEGKELWRRVFEEGLSETAYKDAQNAGHRYYLGDVNHDGKTELLFVLFPHDPARPMRLLCFSDRGKQLWAFQPSGPAANVSGDHPYNGPYFIKAIDVIPGRTTQVVISSSPLYPFLQVSQLVILDAANGAKIGNEFWNDGPLEHLAHADLIGMGRPQLIAAGFDSTFQNAILIVTDPANMPLRSFTLKPIVKADVDKELAFVIFYPTDAVDTQRVSANRARSLEIAGDRIYLTVAESLDENDLKRIMYQLDFKLNIVAASASVAYMQFYEDLAVHHKVPVDPDHGMRKAMEQVLRAGIIFTNARTVGKRQGEPPVR